MNNHIIPFRYEWIWKKSAVSGFLNAKKMPLKVHENILIFYEKLPYYEPQKTYGHSNWKAVHKVFSSNYDSQRVVIGSSNDGSRYPVDVLEFSTVSNSSKLHPTQKPVSLLEYLIKTYTREGEIVLDNCMGSGSTGVACLNTGRNFIGIELEQKYFDIAKNRIYEAEGMNIEEKKEEQIECDYEYRQLTFDFDSGNNDDADDNFGI